MSPADPMGQAHAFHHAGSLDAAAGLYRLDLELEPNHFDALHRAGIIAYQWDKLAEAVERFGRALAINSRYQATRFPGLECSEWKLTFLSIGNSPVCPKCGCEPEE